jgi:hypothetical protein
MRKNNEIERRRNAITEDPVRPIGRHRTVAYAGLSIGNENPPPLARGGGLILNWCSSQRKISSGPFR